MTGKAYIQLWVQMAQQNWADPDRQHDVFEYLSHLVMSVPAVSTPRAEAGSH